jgi:hypothetical protein
LRKKRQNVFAKEWNSIRKTPELVSCDVALHAKVCAELSQKFYMDLEVDPIGKKVFIKGSHESGR